MRKTVLSFLLSGALLLGMTSLFGIEVKAAGLDRAERLWQEISFHSQKK